MHRTPYKCPICVIGKTILRGVSVVSFVREVRTCGLTTYRHKAQDGIRFIVSKQLVLSMPDKNNTNRGQDVVFLTNTALRSRLRHKVLTRSRALSLPENTASDSRATKSSQNRTKIKKRSEKIDQ